MERMQPPGADPVVDGRRTESQPQQVRARNDASLPVRNRGDRGVGCEFASHIDA